MKRLTAMLLALVMVFSLSVTAFADEAGTETTANKATANEASEYKASIDVNGKYISRLDSDKIISVDVKWQDMNFTYYAKRQGTWNPAEHTYDGEKTATWDKTTSDITVTNHSNAEVTATLSYTPSVTSVEGKLSEETLTLESAAQEKYMGDNANQAPSATSTFTISGTMNDESGTDLGTITVALKEGSSAGDTDNGNEWTVVYNYDDLKTALGNGGNIRLANDITMTEYAGIENTVTLDLNNCTLTAAGNGLWVYDGASLSVKNGTIVNKNSQSIKNNGGIVSVEECTIEGEIHALYHQSGTSSLKNCTLNGKLTLHGSGTITLSDTITFNSASVYEGYKGISVVNGSTGSVICHFDPNDNIYEGTVTENDDGTWIVTAP